MTHRPTRRRVLKLGGTATGFGLAGCLGAAGTGDGVGSTDGDEAPGATDDPNAVDDSDVDAEAGRLGNPAGTVEVSITSLPLPDLEPGIVHLELGGTVEWVGEGQRNGVSTYHPAANKPQRIPDAADPWSSDILRDGSRFSVTLDREGVYDYFDPVELCGTHESFGNVGRVVVGWPDLDGEPAIEGDPDELPGRVPEVMREFNQRCREVLDR